MLINTIIEAVKDYYDTKVTVIVDNKYYDDFIRLATIYSVKVQTLKELDRSIVVMGMKYKNYLKFMNALQRNELNLKELGDGFSHGLINELIEWDPLLNRSKKTEAA